MNWPPLPPQSYYPMEEGDPPNDYLWDEDRMREYGESCAKAAREEAAKLCDAEAHRVAGLGTVADTAKTLAWRIRKDPNISGE